MPSEQSLLRSLRRPCSCADGTHAAIARQSIAVVALAHRLTLFIPYFASFACKNFSGVL